MISRQRPTVWLDMYAPVSLFWAPGWQRRLSMTKHCLSSISALLMTFALVSAAPAQEKKLDKIRLGGGSASATQMTMRSEERRVGKECEAQVARGRCGSRWERIVR